MEKLSAREGMIGLRICSVIPYRVVRADVTYNLSKVAVVGDTSINIETRLLRINQIESPDEDIQTFRRKDVSQKNKAYPIRGLLAKR